MVHAGKMMSDKTKRYALLYSGFLIYSMFGVLAKLAGAYPLISLNAVLLYGAGFCALGLYAILWQQVLKRMPLTVAFPNKAVTIPLGMLWGVILFGESVNLSMLLGAAVIAAGIVLVTRNG